MKGFIYTILIIIILVIGVIVFLGRDGTTPPDTDFQDIDQELMDNQENTATSTDSENQDETATSTDETNGSSDETSGAVKEFNLTGENFAFSEDELVVQKGDRVRITFESTGGFHDWVVDAFDAATERVQEGGTTSVEFVADEAGEFEYYCSVGSHRQLGMVGTLIVEE